MNKDRDKGEGMEQTSASVLQFVEGAQLSVCSTSNAVLPTPVDKKKYKKNQTLQLNL